MSDYFAALLRATGLTAKAPAADHAVVELEAFAEAPVAAPSPVAKATAVMAAESVAAPVVAATPTSASVPPATATREQATRHPAESALPLSINPHSVSPPNSHAEVSQQALLQSVLRWVASDPQPLEETAQAPTAASPLATADTLISLASTVLPTAPATAEQQPQIKPARTAASANIAPAAPAVTVATPGPIPRLPSAVTPNSVAQVLEQPAAEPSLPTPATAAAAAPLSLSIGAIHLRVEAPPAAPQPKAASKPAERQPGAAPRTPTPPRSGLSRRALRSF